MVAHKMSYVRLPDDLGGGVVEAERSELPGGGYSYTIFYRGSQQFAGHTDGMRSFHLMFDEPLEEIAPPEPAGGSTMFGPSSDNQIGIYRRVDDPATQAQLGEEYRWWAAGFDEPMRWPQAWHCARGMRPMRIEEDPGFILNVEM